MALKVYKPITAGTRGRIDLRKDELTADKPEKGLTSGKKSGAVATPMAGLRSGIRVAVTSSVIAILISSATSTEFRERLIPSSMIRTEAPISPSCSMLTVRSGTLSLPRD